MKLDRATLNTLTLPPGKSEKKYFDERLAGHGVRVRHPSDQSKWRWITQFDKDGKTQTVTNGPVTLIEPGAAFKRSRDLLASVRLGGDPAAEKQKARARAAETFGAILPRYLAEQRGEWRPRSFKELERHLVKHAKPLHRRPLTSIDRREISDLISAITKNSGTTAAINAHGSLSGYFSWLMRTGLLDVNPMPYTNKPKPRPSRDYLISETELCALWTALGDDEYADLIRLLIYTALRRSEIGGLVWDEVDLDRAVIEIPAARMKNGHPHLVPLSDPALAILQKRQHDGHHVFGRSGFQGWSWLRKRLDARIAGPRPGWTLHDFRRLASTTMHERLGIQPHIVERLLAHHQGGISAVYNLSDYATAKRRALQRWAEYVDAVVSGKAAPAKVVKLRT